MKNRETVLKGKDGCQIIRIWVAPDPPDRMEHYILYRVEGHDFKFLSAGAAWRKARELKRLHET